ncbi:Arm DNA-binding domain-containing protein [Pseudomonas aeruginosa]
MSAIPDAAALSALPPQSKPYRITIGHGLYLEVTPQGSKLWRIKYRFAGKENKLSLGAFPPSPWSRRVALVTMHVH